MDARTPKRPRLSHCSLDFISRLVSLHKDLLNDPEVIDTHTRSRSASALNTLLSYGMDVNTSLRNDTSSSPSQKPSSTCPFLNLCAVAGEVNCDIEDMGNINLAHNAHARSEQLIQI